MNDHFVSLIAECFFHLIAVNRLDRLTSGLMIIGLSSSCAHTLSQEFVRGGVKKEYIARCSGEFPTEEVVIDQPLLTVDRQMGLNIVHPQGKVCHMTSSLPTSDFVTLRQAGQDGLQTAAL
jgi:23S rRNA-/tRNA-specific pseudouridylate synthase